MSRAAWRVRRIDVLPIRTFRYLCDHKASAMSQIGSTQSEGETRASECCGAKLRHDGRAGERAQGEEERGNSTTEGWDGGFDGAGGGRVLMIKTDELKVR